MSAHTWDGSIWGTPFSTLQYQMVGKPDSEGWAKFQCLSDLQRVREWKVGDMRPLNAKANAAIAAWWMRHESAKATGTTP